MKDDDDDDDDARPAFPPAFSLEKVMVFLLNSM